MKKINEDEKIKLNRIAKKKHLKKVKRNKKRLSKRQNLKKARRFVKSKFIPNNSFRELIDLIVPPYFSLGDDLNTVISFINLLKSYAKISKEVRVIKLNLINVERIDIGAISLLLSSIKELGLNDIRVTGDLPMEGDCLDTIVKSGFLEHMFITDGLKKSINGSSPKQRNLMIMKGRDKTDHRTIGESIKRAIFLLSGKEAHYQPLYGVIGEMNINSVEHAYRKQKHWVLAINHNVENNKIIFTFTDNGYGIYKTLKRKISLKTFEMLGLKSEIEILEGMFLKKYSSRFKKQYNRNKGLPAIRNLQIDNKVDNLSVISNNIYMNFETGTKIVLDNEFSGTFYYWELSLETYEKRNS